MKLTIESTDQTVKVNGMLCRVWEAKSEKGTPAALLVAGIAVRADIDNSEFESELAEMSDLGGFMGSVDGPNLTKPVEAGALPHGPKEPQLMKPVFVVNPLGNEVEEREIPDSADPPNAILEVKGRVDIYGDESAVARAQAKFQALMTAMTDGLEEADLTFDLNVEILRLAPPERQAGGAGSKPLPLAGKPRILH